MHAEDSSVFILLEQIGHLSRYHAIKKMEMLGLRPGQAGILFILNCEGTLSQKKLAEKMGITPPSMTVALRKLENGGYIVKEPDRYDQRVFQICLSEKGRECIDELKRIAEDMEALLFQGMSYEEKLFLKRLLSEMRKNLVDSKDFRGMDMRSVIKKTHSPMHMDERKIF